MLDEKDYIPGTLEEVFSDEGLIKCYNGSYNCIRQTEILDDWLGPWISFLWFLFLIASGFSIRMIYKTYVKFRDTLARRKENGEYEFKEGLAYDVTTALGVWKIEDKPVEKRIKILYRVYCIPLLIAWSDLFLDIGYVSSFVSNETRMLNEFIHVENSAFVVMGIFDIVGCFRIFLCGVLLWKFTEKLDTESGATLARIEVHMEVIVIAFAFILEDFAELFVEYFVVEKFITFYDYETSAQSFAAGISSVTLNLIALVSFLGFVMSFRKQHKYQHAAMNTLSMVVPLMELILSSLRTYRFLFQAFGYQKFRPGCVWLAAIDTDENNEPLYIADQHTFSKECFRPLDWIMVILMCSYLLVLIIFIFVYIFKIRPEYELELSNMTPDNLLGDLKKLPTEVKQRVLKPVVKPVTYVAGKTGLIKKEKSDSNNPEEASEMLPVDYDPNVNAAQKSEKETE